MRFALSITHNLLLEPVLKTFGTNRENSYVEVLDDALHVKMGAWFDETIPFSKIKSFAPSDWPWWGGLGVKLHHHGIGVVGSTEHIVNLELTEVIAMKVIIKVEAERLWISLEDRDGFFAALAERTGKSVSPHSPF